MIDRYDYDVEFEYLTPCLNGDWVKFEDAQAEIKHLNCTLESYANEKKEVFLKNNDLRQKIAELKQKLSDADSETVEEGKP